MIIDGRQLVRLALWKVWEGVLAGLLLVAFFGLLIVLAVAHAGGSSAGCAP